MKPLDQVGFRDWRRWATGSARGKVLEIGVGTGLNFSYYHPEAQVIAFDRDAGMLEELQMSPAPERISVLRADAMELPFPDGAFDAVVGTLVLCTIPDPRLALSEAIRVMKPGAPLRLVEHVRARNPVAGRVMDAAAPLWNRLTGGCHLNRNTFDTVRNAGFEIDSVEKTWFGLFIGIEAHK